jgi:OOP family OmpA-OmpF porin
VTHRSADELIGEREEIQMKSKWLRGAMVLVALTIVGGCASSKRSFVYEPHEFDPDYWVAKVDRFVVIVDASLTMSERYRKEPKIDIERDLLYSMAQSIPDLEYEAGLRSFGGGKCLPKGKTTLVKKVEEFSTGGFAATADDFSCPSGYSPLNLAIDAAAGDLMGGPGRTAVIAISDGLHMGKKTVAAAQRLVNQFGDDTCIYTVQVGDDKRGAKVLQKVANTSACGATFNAADLTGSAAMAKFVEEALLYPDSDADGVPDHLDTCPDTPRGVSVDATGCPLDSDGDGVPDHLDKCPGTPKGTVVDASGCPIDSDGDGVPDNLDKCPNTPKGVKVDRNGCPLDSDGDGVPDHLDKCPGTPRGVPVDATGCPPEGITVHGNEWMVTGAVLFDVNKWALKPAGKQVLIRAAEFLKANQQWIVEIQGHTDSRGPKAWNMTLSQRRAESVKEHLVNLGVPADRLLATGYGPADPIAANDTAEGRARNRRVDFAPRERK